MDLLKKLRNCLWRTLIKIHVKMTDLTDKEKKLLIKMMLEEHSVQSGVRIDPDEEKEREALREKLRERREMSDKILEVENSYLSSS